MMWSADRSTFWWRAVLFAVVLLCAARIISAQESEPSTSAEPTLSTIASTLRSLSAELTRRLDERRAQAAELSQSGTSIASQLSGAMQSDELSMSELSAQSASTSQALASSVTASMATTISLSDASDSSTSLSQGLNTYAKQMTQSRDRWRVAAIAAASIALASTGGLILLIAFD